MNKDNFKEKLQRYEDGTATPAERAVVEAWYRSYRPDEHAETSAEKTEALKNTIKQNIQQRTKIRAINRHIIYRIAAGIVLAVGVSLLGYYFLKTPSAEKFTVVKTGAGKLKEVMLPDSSVMWVNAMSHIRVTEDFSGPLRKVYIDGGEAFFKVKHNKQRPFRVYVAGLQVQVLGTSFNIRAYKGLPSVQVGVATGKVSVSFNDKVLGILTPGNELTFDRNSHAYNKHAVDMAQSQGWRDGKTYLNQASFAELAVVVKNLFNINLKAADSKVGRYQFTLRLQRDMEPVEALKVISLIHNTHYRKEGDEVVLF